MPETAEIPDYGTCYSGHVRINSLLLSATARTSVAAIQQIADWLKKLGVPEGIKRHAEIRIDASRTDVIGRDTDVQRRLVSLR